jgi:hypothetical protein
MTGTAPATTSAVTAVEVISAEVAWLWCRLCAARTWLSGGRMPASKAAGQPAMTLVEGAIFANPPAFHNNERNNCDGRIAEKLKKTVHADL